LTDALSVALEGPLEWTSFDIPGGRPPVLLSRLRTEPASRASTMLVRFPDGWAREGSGYYETSEEFVVLEGALGVSDEWYEPGDWAFVPAGALRTRSRSDGETLALARFSGPARWIPSTDAATTEPSLRHRLEPAGAGAKSPLGAPASAWPLHRGAGVESWLVEPGSTGSVIDRDAELLDIVARVWRWVPAGAPVPRLAGPTFCRIFESPSSEGGAR
jgi:hypothetical protein